MRAGERQAFITVRKVGAGVNEHNEPVPEWVLHGQMWARLFPLRGYEVDRNTERHSVAIYRCQVDYIEGRGITAAMKVEFEDLTFNIVSVHHDLNTRKTTDLMLAEVDRGA